jgi:long-chain acyl-CoA synthetase
MPEQKPWFRFWPEGVPLNLDYPEVPLFELLSTTTRKHPDNLAFSYRRQTLTYQKLDTLTDRLAAGLHRLGIGKGSRIVLLLPNGLDFVIAYYGILKTGGTVVPVNPLDKPREIAFYLRDSGAVGLITEEKYYSHLKEAVRECRLSTVILTDTGESEGILSLPAILETDSPTPTRPDIDPKEDVATLQYTGGTTGFPKGVMLTHYNLVVNALQNAVWFHWTTREKVVGLLPFYHSWGACTGINSPVYCGARVIIIPRFDPAELLETIARERATVLYGATSLFTMLVGSPLLGEYDLSSLRYVKAGAMPIPPEIMARWQQLTGVPMILGYGLSEASPETHDSPPQRVKPGSIGIPVMDTDAMIVDQATGETPLPPSEVGEIIIRGPQVMKGYLNRPDENAQALRDGWLYTGDLGMMDEEGYFYITDRKKDIIKYKGYSVAPAEIEAVLYEHPAVRECAVVGRPDALAGEVPRAYVVLHDGCSPCAEELIQFCEQRVAAYKKVREVEFVAEIPKTRVGKVLRRLLRDSDRGGF